MIVRTTLTALAAALALATPAAAVQRAGRTAPVAEPRTRLLVLTDIGNEPDDAESMVRLLLYANDIDIEGLLATTSRHLRETVNPAQIVERIEAYRQVLPNLKVHDKRYPEADALLARVKSGRPELGMVGVGDGKDTEASEWIIKTIDAPDPRPVWVTVWGGAVDLAQALRKVRATRTPEQLAAFVAKLRVYSISDQDDAGPWIRREFPDLFWIASIHAPGRYGLSTWAGISGDRFYGFDGPDFATVSKEWLRDNIQRGALGTLYPTPDYIMEGDTPSFLYLIPNGLGSPEHPDYGSWGGRYARLSPWSGLWTDTIDTVNGVDEKPRQSNQATVWRWRDAYQNDFAARIQWTLQASAKGANHNPVLVLNGSRGKAPVEITAAPGEVVQLSGEGSRDPDGNRVDYSWWQYRESEASSRSPIVELVRGDPMHTRFTAPEVKVPTRFHIIFEGRDNGTPSLYAYRRAIVTVQPRAG